MCFLERAVGCCTAQKQTRWYAVNFFQGAGVSDLKSGDSSTECFLIKALHSRVRVAPLFVQKHFALRLNICWAEEKSEVLHAVPSPLHLCRFSLSPLSRDYADKREEARQAREERSVPFISTVFPSQPPQR